MTLLANPALEGYTEAHTTPLPPELVEVARETAETLGSAQMLSRPVVGRLLDILVHALRAELVLEVGAFSGVNAIVMAAQLAPGGRLISCEVDPVRAEFARRRISEAGFADRAEVRLGPALGTIAEIEGPIDLVFIDADKAGYLDYYEAVLPKLAQFGLIVADNTLRAGQIVDPREGDADTLAMLRFNEHVRNDERVVATLLSVRGGVTVIRRTA